MHTAAGLVLQRGDAPSLVAGAGIFIDYLAVADKVALKRLHHLDGLVKNGLILAAVEEDGFRTEHLRYLGEDSRAAQGDEPVGKLVCEQIIPFSQVPRELWIQYADKDAYLAGEKELLDLLKTSDGNDTVIIYLGRERAKKVLPRNWNVRAGEALVTTLSEMLGEKNVKVVEKPLGKISS